MSVVLRHRWIALCLTGAIYLFARLPGLLALPLFNDEAIYLVRAQRFPAELQFTIHDGKFIHELLLAILVRLPWDPLLTGRLFSVICGLLTIVALWIGGRIIGYEASGIAAGLFYVCSPLAAVHDRLAIPDAMLGCLAGFVLAASLRFGSMPHPQRRDAAGVGALIALAGLVKLPGLFLFAIPVLAALLLPATRAERRRRAGLLRTALIIALIALAALAPFNYGGAESRKVGALDLAQQIGRFSSNLALAGEWLALTLPLPLALLALFGLRAPTARRHVALLLITGGLLHLVFAALGSVIYPRYFLPAWPSLLLAAGISAAELRHERAIMRSTGLALLAATIAWGGYFTVEYASHPARAPLAAIDRRQYIEAWTAGYGLPELYATLRTEAAQAGPMTLVSPVHERVVHIGPMIYLSDDPLIQHTTVDLRDPDAAAQLSALAVHRNIYLALDADEVQAFDIERRFPDLVHIQAWHNPYSTMTLHLYATRKNGQHPERAPTLRR